MALEFKTHFAHALLAAGASLAMAAALAAGGYSVTQDQEALVKVGMTTFEVQQALGQPEQISQYAIQPLTTWSYAVARDPERLLKFNVDFTDGGIVSAFGEQKKEINGGRGRRR